MITAPEPAAVTDKSFDLWKTFTEARKEFGSPEAFRNGAHSTWVSFTVTCHEPIFSDLMKDFTGREARRGGLIRRCNIHDGVFGAVRVDGCPQVVKN